jgi:glucose-6-phosphate 1-dehydrogenase
VPASRLPDPATVVIFGATGDLAHRKVLPALYNLRRAGLLPAGTAFVGFARRPFTDATYREEARRAVAEHSRVPIDPAVWDDAAGGPGCPPYPAGSRGPTEAEALMAHDGRRWRLPPEGAPSGGPATSARPRTKGR